jgi:hypothetical protein
VVSKRDDPSQTLACGSETSHKVEIGLRAPKGARFILRILRQFKFSYDCNRSLPEFSARVRIIAGLKFVELIEDNLFSQRKDLRQVYPRMNGKVRAAGSEVSVNVNN